MAITPIYWVAISLDIEVLAVGLGEVQWSIRMPVSHFEAGIVLECAVH